MEMVQATVILFGIFGVLLAMLFVALIAGAAAADRARVATSARRAHGLRR
jgi:hypothetical protein